MDNFRIFISYSRKDQEIFEKLVNDLEKRLKIHILSDKNIKAGTPFSNEIKSLIIHAHIFLPLLTNNSKNSPWVHQETGFAIAHKIPILPVALENAKLPAQMLSQLQAILVNNDLSDISEKIDIDDIKRLIFPLPVPQEMIQIAKWPEDRAKLIVEHSKRITQFGKYGKIRQQGAFTSFCIPDEDLDHKIWKDREGNNNKRSDYYHYLQREERRILEKHAQNEGCRLIIYPDQSQKDWKKTVHPTRLGTLLDFLNNISNEKCEVVVSDRPTGGNLLIVGDWFVAESMVPKKGGYLQTIFNWNAQNAQKRVAQFDNHFNYLCQKKGLTIAKAREEAKIKIEKKITELEEKYNKPENQEFNQKKNISKKEYN